MYKSIYFWKAVNKLLLWFRMCYDLFIINLRLQKGSDFGNHVWIAFKVNLQR